MRRTFLALAVDPAELVAVVADGRTVRGRLAGSDDTTATIVTKSGEVVPLEIGDAVALKQVVAPPPPPSAQPLTLEGLRRS